MNSASVLVWWLIAPMIYSISEIVCPKGGYTSSRTNLSWFFNRRGTSLVASLPEQERAGGNCDDDELSSIESYELR